jgi:small GTP-binding protein
MPGDVEKRKVCMLGATGVGKTSLVTRFVRSIFSESYQTTIGVKIDQKRIVCDGRALDLVLWDLSGEDEFQSVQLAYIRGAAGLLVVIDGSRVATVYTALRLLADASEVVAHVPVVLVLNKSDLVASCEIEERAERALRERGFPLIKASAKTGVGVEEAFDALARALIEDRGRPGRDIE